MGAQEVSSLVLGENSFLPLELWFSGNGWVQENDLEIKIEINLTKYETIVVK